MQYTSQHRATEYVVSQHLNSVVVKRSTPPPHTTYQSSLLNLPLRRLIVIKTTIIHTLIQHSIIDSIVLER